MFTHLHGHDHYSLLQGLGDPEAIVEKIKELGMESVAITDYAGMYGMVEFYQAAENLDIKPIIGLEISVVDDISHKRGEEKRNYITLLAKNYQGYKNLMKISSEGNLEGYYKRARIDYQILRENSENIMAFMGGRASQLGCMILANKDDSQLKEKIKEYQNIFGQDNFFLEIIAQEYENIKGLEKVNNKINELGEDMDIDLITNNNFHYINDDEKKAYETLLCIKDDVKIYDPHHESIDGDYHIFGEKQIRQTLKNIGFDEEKIQTMIDNNNKIADQIDIDLPLGDILFPNYETPENIEKLYEENKDSLVE